MKIKLKEYAEEFLQVNLVKWPQMLVWGHRIQPKQAMEIIRRTDTFFTNGYGGNDHGWTNEAKQIIGMPDMSLMVGDYDRVKWNTYYQAQRDFDRRWQVVETQYVRNAWVSSAYIGGPSGWCHPDGTIHNTSNVGKWPSGLELYSDWLIISRAFPYLDLTVAFMGDEACNNSSVVEMVMHIKQGNVHIPSTLENPFNRFGITISDVQYGTPTIEEQVNRLTLPVSSREHQFGLNQIRKWNDELL